MRKVVIVGAGLVGSLLSVYLARKGHDVEVYERNPDIRKGHAASGRSINLTLCNRGFKALDSIGVGDLVRDISVPVFGRLMHDLKGELTFQPYGNNNEAIYSISRADLNRTLLDFAEQNCGIDFHFDQRCIDIDLATAGFAVKNSETGRVRREKADVIFGSDGAHSVVRYHMQSLDRFDYSQQYWDQGYRELRIPPDVDGGWTSEKNVLHIWPRGEYMMIAFPNTDGSFSCSLHIPFEGEHSFEAIKTERDLLAFFQESFPDTWRLMPNLAGDFFSKAPNSMITIKCWPWTYDQRVALIGDSAHSIYPSYGQGANAGFEDCQVLDECLERCGDDWRAALHSYELQRKPNTDAIADLCVGHFIELRNSVGNQTFLLRKEIERKINRMYPDKYKDLYSMVTFTCIPYSESLRIDQEQRAIVDEIMKVEGIQEELDSQEVESLIDRLMQAREFRH